jgi:N-acetylglucosamine-6-phosphate deacetylase
VRLGVSAALIGDKLVSGDLEIENGVVGQFGVGHVPGSSIALPGFIDVHVHGRDGVDFTDAATYDYIRVSRKMSTTGVTAYQPTLAARPVDEMVKTVSLHPGAMRGGAKVLGFHLEGPFLSPEMAGAQRKDALTAPSLETARRIVTAGPVAQMTVAPELEDIIPVIEYLAANAVTVSLGHSAGSRDETNRALESGATAFTHVFNAMAPLHHREPGILGVALAHDSAYLTAIFDHTHLSDEVERLLIRSAAGRLVAITDGTAAVGREGTGSRLGDRLTEVSGGAPRLPDGTLAGSLLTMDDAFRSLVELGLSIDEASRTTAANPAAMSGRDDLGTLVPGSPADIVVLDDGYRVIRTVVDGKEVFSA